MPSQLSLTFLGTGTSVGVPVIGCDCNVCQSSDPRNKRTRSSVVVQAGEVRLLVDSGPDLRSQALRENLRRIDAVIYTHAHLDHVAGFDELRAFCWARSLPLPMHATAGCMDSLTRMFGWAFSRENTHQGYVRPAVRIVDGPFDYGDLQVTPIPVLHASVETVGYRFDYRGAASLAYLPDVKHVPASSRHLLHGIDVLIVDALRQTPHPTHFTVSEALELAAEVAAGRTWLTHLGHESDHAELQATLPESVRVAWDGLKLSLPDLA
jgi:phosphoribosyl 1,2-cyclic phosphate phosphodiesterase